MFSVIISSLLRSVEFFRSGMGKWFTLGLEKIVDYKIFLLPLFIWGVIRLVISLFGSVCSAIREKLSSLGFSGIQVGGVDVLSLANSVLPIDELIALLIAWFGVASVVASIRFIRAAWSAVPLKAS